MEAKHKTDESACCQQSHVTSFPQAFCNLHAILKNHDMLKGHPVFDAIIKVMLTCPKLEIGSLEFNCKNKILALWI